MIAEQDLVDPHTAGRVRQELGGLLLSDALVGGRGPTGRPRVGLLVALIGVAVGAAIALVPYYVTTADELSTDSRATGTVTRVLPAAGERCTAEAAFAVDGATHTARSEDPRAEDCRYEVGDQVRVRYDSSDPSRAAVGPRHVLGLLPFFVLGSIVALGAASRARSLAATALWAAATRRRGNRMVLDHSPTRFDDAVVTEARERLREQLDGRR